MQEKRKIKRWRLFHDAHFRREGAGRYLNCMLCDISFWGAKISCQETLREGDTIEMCMNIPDSLHPLISKAKVIYGRPMHRLYYEYGLSFIDMKQKAREKIYDYIYKNYPKEFSKSIIKNGRIGMKGGEEKMFTEAPQEDRRIFARLPVDLYARYFDSEDNKEGYFCVKDISAKGMGVTTKEKFKPKTRLEMWVSVPGHSMPIYTRGEVIWEKPDYSGKGFRAGITLEKADFMNFPAVIKG